MDIDDKVNELLPDIRDYLDSERVKQINENSQDAKQIKFSIRNISVQTDRNRKIAETAIDDLVKNDPRKAKLVFGWLRDLEEEINKGLGIG